ncbi:hypothetical protein [Pedobacter arcticus]|uniref:hypothetical protein n=1 Tax=Pedobacter arcticus TaxID=752140 RepID=UPI0002D55D81|nr:hypothetical protein [Pedobacter arcticus]
MKHNNTAIADSQKLEMNIDVLNYAQKQRYYYLFPIYNDHSVVVNLVLNIQGRGRNSWTNINKKISLLNDSERDIQQYHDAIYDNFEIDEVYSPAETIGIVADVRRDLGLPPYINRLKKFCEEDFFNLFIVDDVFEDIIVGQEVQKKFIGYKPVVRLKPED